MKSIFASNNKKRDSKVFGFEVLTNNEMLKVRGGIKPKTRPVDDFDISEN